MSGADTLDFDVVEEQPLATEITRQWEVWNGGRAEWRSRVEENKKYVYATSTNETTNIQNAHNHTTHIPKIAQISDNLIARTENGSIRVGHAHQNLGSFVLPKYEGLQSPRKL